MAEKKSKSSKGSAAGRNQARCLRYATRKTREVNKAKRLLRHLRVRKNDRSALAALQALDNAGIVFGRELQSKITNLFRQEAAKAVETA